MKKGLLAIAFLMFISACEDKSAAPHWDNVCIEKKVKNIMMPMTINGVTTMRLQPVTKCTKREWHCVAGGEYDGDLTCPVMTLEMQGIIQWPTTK